MGKILLASPHMSDEGFEQQYINEAFETNWIAPLGENVDKFEKEMIELTNCGYAVALSSGTAALHLALKAVGVKRGDTVLCQTLTFSASANPIIYEGATPIFIDSENDGWNMDVNLLENAIKKYKPKAVIVVHLYGLASRIQEIVDLCHTYGVAVIEDAAESLGTTINGKWTGTFGDIGIFSFNGNKIITTSGGGMMVSQHKEYVDKARFWSTQAREPFLHYEHKEIGYNYRLSNVLSGIGRGQFRVLPQRIEKKREIFENYYRELSGIEGIEFILEKEGEHSNYWLSTIIINHPQVTASQVIQQLAEQGIESRPVWKPMHLQPIFESEAFEGNERAQFLFEHGVCMPSDTKMTRDQQSKVIQIIKEMF